MSGKVKIFGAAAIFVSLATAVAVTLVQIDQRATAIILATVASAVVAASLATMILYARQNQLSRLIHVLPLSAGAAITSGLIAWRMNVNYARMAADLPLEPVSQWFLDGLIVASSLKVVGLLLLFRMIYIRAGGK